MSRPSALSRQQVKKLQSLDPSRYAPPLEALSRNAFPLRDLLGIQSQPGPSITSITQSASNLWSWRDIKRVDVLDKASPTVYSYLEEFRQILSLSVHNHPLALPPSPLPDIDLCILSERHGELHLQKTILFRVNAALQMICDKFTSQDGDEQLDLLETFPGLIRRPVYSPGLRSGSAPKNNAMIPDLWCHSFLDLMQKDPPLIIGDVKLYRKWNSSLGRSADNDSLICYRTTLAQVNLYMVIKHSISSFIITERELVIVERVAGWSGWLKVSKPFIGHRDISIALIGLCLRACNATVSYIELGEPREASPDAYYPSEETEPPSSSSKPDQSTTSYS